MTTATIREVRLTIPEVAVRESWPLDWLRCRFRKNSELAALLDRAGPTRFIREVDLPRVREVLTANHGLVKGDV